MKNFILGILSCIAMLNLTAQKNPNYLSSYIKTNNLGFDDEIIENDKKGFTYAVDLGVYLASKKTANIYNGAGGIDLNNQTIWRSISERFALIPDPSAISQTINNELPQYNGTVTGFFFPSDYLPVNLNYSPRLYFGLGATYHFNDYWAVLVKSSLANLKTTGVYTMNLIGPVIPQNATSVIEIFDITGEERRVHFDLGFKNTSYNDYGFKWFWGAGASLVGTQIVSNVAWIGRTQYPLLLNNSPNIIQNPEAAETLQSNFNLGYYATTGWEMEYNDRYDFGIGFVLSRDPIELAGTTQKVYNKRIYITFGI